MESINIDYLVSTLQKFETDLKTHDNRFSMMGNAFIELQKEINDLKRELNEFTYTKKEHALISVVHELIKAENHHKGFNEPANYDDVVEKAKKIVDAMFP